MHNSQPGVGIRL